MKILKKFYGLIRLLSLDVAFGAVVITNAISDINGLLLPVSVSFALFIAVWFIYTLDHWLDARRLHGKPSMPRHQFHLKYSRPLFFLMIAQLTLGAVDMFFLPIETFYIGLMIGVSVILYFLFSILFKVVLIKEVLIASTYAVGIFTGPVSLGASVSVETLIALIIVFGLAFVNLILIAMYEMSYDIKDGSHSWPIRFGYRSSYFLMTYSIYILLALIAFNSFYSSGGAWLLNVSFFLMTLVLYYILNRPKWFRQNERYRIYADSIFFIPGVMLLLI